MGLFHQDVKMIIYNPVTDYSIRKSGWLLFTITVYILLQIKKNYAVTYFSLFLFNTLVMLFAFVDDLFSKIISREMEI